MQPLQLMTKPLTGRLLLAAGGLIIVAGSFLPEIIVAGSNLLHPESRLPSPERSHWGVFQESLDMLSDPDFSVDWWYYAFYALEAAGLAYLVASGSAMAVSSLFVRSRAAALAFSIFHAVSSLGLFAGSLVVFLGATGAEGRSGGLAVALLLGSVLFGGLFVAEMAVAWKVSRRRTIDGLTPVDAANALPAGLLLVSSSVLYVVLAGHPNWPAGGYLVSALGALLVTGGMVIRRATVSV